MRGLLCRCLGGLITFHVLVVGWPLIHPFRTHTKSKPYHEKYSNELFLSEEGHYAQQQHSPDLTGSHRSIRNHEYCNTVDKRTPPTWIALDHFLSVRNDLNRIVKGGVEVISRGSSNVPKHQKVDIAIFVADGLDSQTCIITVVAKGRRVSASKLKLELGSEASIYPLTRPGDARVLCGFTVDTVPPMGHLSDRRITVAVDQDVVLRCQMENLMMLGNGGYAYWQTLISPEAILALPNAKVVSIGADEDATGPPSGTESATVIHLDQDCENESIRDAPVPFLELEPPPMNIASLLVHHRELSNPLVTNVVSFKGKIGRIDRRGRRNASFELLPLEEENQSQTCSNDRNTSCNLPWQIKNGEQVALRINAGKQLLQNLGKVAGELALDRLEAGIIIEALARTNVGHREALASWVNDRTMECMLVDFQIINSEGETEINSAASDLGNKLQSEAAIPVLPPLTLSCIFSIPASIEVVDNPESLDVFEEALDFLVEHRKRPMVGIDCEWQPNQLSRPGVSQPVLLMQLSFNDLGKVFLFDLQVLLRPLLDQGHPMNDSEGRLSEVLERLWSSSLIMKVGYQVTSDLRRVAASFPHIPCFQEIDAVLEVDKLVKRILHTTKQKKSRSITTSVSRMSLHYMGRPVDKSYQISDWQRRPLSDGQKEYAALDAAVAPAIVEKALRTMEASLNLPRLNIEHWERDDRLSDIVESLRFTFIPIEGTKPSKNQQAKQVLGDHWIATETWITGDDPGNQ
jgi:prolyl-tRNA editing enzyme YbaK/EbsC (Cys-tRNA(Pro) deacylase)